MSGQVNMVSQLINPYMDWCSRQISGSSGLSGLGSGMESMGQPERYGVMMVTRLQSLSPKREAVCLKLLVGRCELIFFHLEGYSI